MTVRDEAISSRVHEALSGDRRLSGMPIGVRVTDGDVFLKGVVDSQEQIDVMRFLLMGVAGVRHVNVDELQAKEQRDE